MGGTSGGSDGLLVVDKPSGPTSHDVVDRVRTALGVRRAGHTGTLDPFATGVLPVCIGKATRLARFLAAGEKAYRATVRLGFATTTDDLSGEPLGEPVAVGVSADALRAACKTLTGEHRQAPPLYSAKRVGGRRAYDLARGGVALALEPVTVTVHALEVLAIERDRLEIEVRCSSGTYVRALARDLGAALGVGGHLVALRRTCSAGFGVEHAVAWEELASHGRERLLPLGALLTDLPAVRVESEGLLALRHGRDLGPGLVQGDFPATAQRLRVLDAQGALLALAVPRSFDSWPPGSGRGPLLHPDVVLVD